MSSLSRRKMIAFQLSEFQNVVIEVLIIDNFFNLKIYGWGGRGKNRTLGFWSFGANGNLSISL